MVHLPNDRGWSSAKRASCGRCLAEEAVCIYQTFYWVAVHVWWEGSRPGLTTGAGACCVKTPYCRRTTTSGYAVRWERRGFWALFLCCVLCHFALASCSCSGCVNSSSQCSGWSVRGDGYWLVQRLAGLLTSAFVCNRSARLGR